uniref:Glycine-rich protein n=1 Tax=Timema tahoe TaxID=61484 RepID=A0A7R9P0G0_9NEOP|nr:unnamed protein product [Timema tahoe]
MHLLAITLIPTITLILTITLTSSHRDIKRTSTERISAPDLGIQRGFESRPPRKLRPSTVSLNQCPSLSYSVSSYLCETDREYRDGYLVRATSSSAPVGGPSNYLGRVVYILTITRTTDVSMDIRTRDTIELPPQATWILRLHWAQYAKYILFVRCVGSIRCGLVKPGLDFIGEYKRQTQLMVSSTVLLLERSTHLYMMFKVTLVVALLVAVCSAQWYGDLGSSSAAAAAAAASASGAGNGGGWGGYPGGWGGNPGGWGGNPGWWGGYPGWCYPNYPYWPRGPYYGGGYGSAAASASAAAAGGNNGIYGAGMGEEHGARSSPDGSVAMSVTIEQLAAIRPLPFTFTLTPSFKACVLTPYVAMGFPGVATRCLFGGSKRQE